MVVTVDSVEEVVEDVTELVEVVVLVELVDAVESAVVLVIEGPTSAGDVEEVVAVPSRAVELVTRPSLGTVSVVEVANTMGEGALATTASAATNTWRPAQEVTATSAAHSRKRATRCMQEVSHRCCTKASWNHQGFLKKE